MENTFIELLPNDWFEIIPPKTYSQFEINSMTLIERSKVLDNIFKPIINVNYNKYKNPDVSKYLALTNKEKLDLLQKYDPTNGNEYYYTSLNLPKNSTYIDILTNEKLREISNKIREIVKDSPLPDIEKNIDALLKSMFTKMELVTREEFDVQTEVLKRTRQKLEELEKKLSEIEAGKK
jgi:BMFP domain-containing protein YqiC